MFQLSKWKTIPILLTVLLGVLFSIPNFLSPEMRAKIPSFLPSSPMVLGLDLQGGSHIVLEVDSKKFKDDLLKQLVGDIRHVMRNTAKVRYSGLGKKSTDSVGVTIKNAADVEKALKPLRALTKDATAGGGLGNAMGFGGGQTADLYTMDVNGQNITFTLSTPGLNKKIGLAIEHILKILSDRINSLGTTEPSIQRQGIDRILVQVPGLQDPKRLKDLLGKTAKLNFQLQCDSQPTAAGQTPPLECEEVALSGETKKKKAFELQRAQCDKLPSDAGKDLVENCKLLPKEAEPMRTMWVKNTRSAIVGGENLVDAQPGFDSRNGQPIVNFRFNTAGGLQFGNLTRKNVGRQFAIILDNEVVSAPVIQTAILGGSGQISGSFTVTEAKDLAIVLRSGALPAELTIVEERTVGPSLGADSVRAGLMASIIGLIAILIFMVASYRLFGIFANIALLANLSLLVGVLSALGATLTLPGIAGIVLTMGMAVDSNVLVFERIREEIAAKRGPLNSIEIGFEKALATILDANFTTFIAAVVLFGLGSGPIKGFAVTLGLGIITTVFTAFTFTRLVVAYWVAKKRPKSVPL